MVKVRENSPRLADGSIDLEAWLAGIGNKRKQSDNEIIRKACMLAKEHGEKVSVIKGESSNCYEQGLIVAEIMDDLGLDVDSLAVGITYYACANANLSFDRIKEELGSKVEYLGLGLRQIDNIHSHNTFDKDKTLKTQSLHNLRKMLLAVVEDIRVVLIKISIHVCDMRVACKQSLKIRNELALEAKELYAPLANRLGIGQLKWELEDLTFRFLEPATYKNIATQLDERRIDRTEFVDKIIAELSVSLERENIKAELSGRAKHIFSIWRKMQRKMVGYNEIYDVRAIRILVDGITDCYAALGVVHTLWQHIPKEFDDYIACPKANGYQSLHTAVIDPNGKVMEIQIRTNLMHKQSELGVAAHWRYKEQEVQDNDYSNKLNSLRKLLDWQEEIEVDSEADDALQAEFVEDRIYVFTPNGDVIDLPKGATAIDFAYHIHTDIGHRCRGAKINGKIVALSKPLTSGLQVTILTAKTGGPSRDWIGSHFKYLVTSRARAKVHQWFKQQDRTQNIQLGRDIINREFKRLNIEKINLKELSELVVNCNSEEDLLSGLGSGDIRVAQVFGAIQRSNNSLQEPVLREVPSKTKSSTKEAEITVDGVGDLVSHMARCCHPIPGDEIIGYITIGEGVAVHRKDCINILQVTDRKRSRLVEVSWGGKESNPYEVLILIKAYNRQGLLNDISAVLSIESVDVININTYVRKNDHITNFKLTLGVSSIEMLGRVLSSIQQIPNVVEVCRTAN